MEPRPADRDGLPSIDPEYLAALVRCRPTPSAFGLAILIQSGVVRPNLSAFARKAGVSRVTVHNDLARLMDWGVVVCSGGGYFATEPDTWNIERPGRKPGPKGA